MDSIVIIPQYNEIHTTPNYSVEDSKFGIPQLILKIDTISCLRISASKHKNYH